MPDVVADTSPVQYLHQIGYLDLLHQFYGRITVPEAVAQEVRTGASLGVDLPAVDHLPWLVIESPSANAMGRVSSDLGPGEREVLALALDKPDPLTIFDDAAARRQAKALGIRCTGTLGVLVKAKQSQVIGALSPVIDALQQAGFFLSSTTRATVLRLAGEEP